MSEQRSGPGDKGGFGPKKPKATFGDVMLGIRAGQGGAPEERGRGGDRGKRPDRGSRPPDRRPDNRADAKPATEAAAAQPASGAESKPHGHEKKPQGTDPGPKRGLPDKKPQGPLVVVKRASGAIETRTLSEPSDVEKDKPAPVEPTAAAVTPTESAPLIEAKPAPAPTRSELYEEIPEHQSFAEMYEASAKQEGQSGRRHVRVGEKVTGTIFQLGADTAFISLGGKSEAMIELRELKDAEGILRQGVGDVVEAHVIEAGAGGIILSKSLAKGSASMAMLADARASGMPVDGLVLSVNKGGLEIAVGDVRAFCPVSQIDIRFVEKPDQFIGEKLKFRVVEVRDRNVVLSRRSLLEEEAKVQAAETRKKLVEGAVISGKITGVRDFGAFVDLGGLEGMIPVSEFSHSRIGHPSEVVKVGDSVEVEILRLEAPNPNSPDKGKQKERITLSMRSRQEDPFKLALAEITEGAKLKGKIVRLQPFGAFVELRPGVDGLIHVSALSNRRIAHPRDVVKVGDEVDVIVEKIDPVEKRIGLRRVTDEGDAIAPLPTGAADRVEIPIKREEAAPRPKVGQVVTGKIDRIEPYGVFVAFPGGKGLVPASETGTDRGTDMKRHFHLGQDLKVSVLEIDATGKIRLSVTAAAQAEERADVEAWKQTQPKGGGKKGFGTFADLLKGKKE